MNTAKALSLAAAVWGAWAVPSRAMPGAAPVPQAPERPSMPVILDPGHGGTDLGAVVKGLREKDIALAIALKLKARLKGLPVILTRDRDLYVTLDQRVVESVDWGGAAFISIHLNEVKSKKMSGAVVYSYGHERRRGRRRKRHPAVPPMPAPPRVEALESEFLARSIVKALREAGIRVEPATKSDYYVLKSPASPSVLVELGFLSNPEEAAKLADSVYQNRLVESLAKAIEEYASERALRPEGL